MTAHEIQMAGPAPAASAVRDEDPIGDIVGRLARLQPSGAALIERAAILADGADYVAVVAWIMAHDGQPEAAVSSAKGGGLHGPRLSASAAAGSRPPVRYVLPPGALGWAT